MEPDPTSVTLRIESTLPKPWEQPETFGDVLYDWMSRAPWLAISAAFHLVVFLIVQAIPWNLFFRPEVTRFEATVATIPEKPFEEPPEELEEPLEEEVLDEEPVVRDIELAESTDEAEESFDAESDLDFASDARFDDTAFNAVLGLGGGAGPLGGRFGRGPRKGRGGSGTERALAEGLEWIVRHQSPDGSWDCDGFAQNCDAGGACDGAGAGLHDIGVTGLALLALLGNGNTSSEGQYRRVVAKGVRWLREQQDPDTGLIGEELGQHFLYDHGIAALAISENYYFTKSPMLARTAQKAMSYILRARAPYGAWRYDVPSVGDNDTSMTGWMVFALKSGEEAGLTIDREAFSGALAWLDEVTDSASGRVGYDTVGSTSSRVEGINDHFPTEKGEAMTAVALLCRFFLGQDPQHETIMVEHANLLARALPEWDPEGFGCDMYYWYYGSYAMYQMGGSHWNAWNRAMKGALLPAQRDDGEFRGSWDPVGPWGYTGGRVYSTALMILCLEVYFRYSRVLGAR